jgi:hypothetical protein
MRLYWRADLRQGQDGYDGGWNNDHILNQKREPATPDEANLVSSVTASGLHMPAIDIDLPCRLVESSTPGHFHLFIDKEIEAEKYWQILRALWEAGIVERGFYELSVARGASFLRTRPKGEREGMEDEPHAAVTALQRFKGRFTRTTTEEDDIPF